jgi:predicted MPP superfamily phosphohydrolase
MITNPPKPFLPNAFVPARPQATRGVSRRGLLKTGLGLTGIASLIVPGSAAYGAYDAATGLSITAYHPVPANWPDRQRLTITVIADLHAGGPNMGIERVRQVVDASNALGSDLIVILGDYFATHRFITEHVPDPAWAAELARLKAPLGRYAILGNHDWWYGLEGVRSALRQERIPLMENDAVLLGKPGNRFWLCGLGDQIAHRLGPNRFQGVDDLPGTLAKVNTNDPVILLAHEPDIFPDVPSRVALTLAGHTHGGQIKLPFIEPVWAPSAFGARFAYGHIVEQGRHMIVSGGLGTSIVPVRIGVTPEILHITLGA